MYVFAKRVESRASIAMLDRARNIERRFGGRHAVSERAFPRTKNREIGRLEPVRDRALRGDWPSDYCGA
ncbi:MAG: hypothetical protein E6Q50_13705 [Lysobacter sp.]|nr:MAG: hypothetical protein E6Q50_13705 [Lysobacter sp.]